MKFLKNNKGFTLVELAIVMIVIGLLIAGIIQGQKLLEATRRTKMIAQVDAYRAALATFLDKYDQFPGDMANAQNRLPQCTAAVFCNNGNSDGRLGVDLLAPAQWYIEDGSAIADERTQFWRHLYFAELIGGVAEGAVVQWGLSHPQSAMGDGGFTVAHGSSPANFGRYYFRLQLSPSGQPNGGASLHAISPSVLLSIEEKIDDKTPSTGVVQGLNPALATLCLTAGGLTYQSTKNYDCLAFFEIGSTI